jgi:hypothetical protein
MHNRSRLLASGPQPRSSGRLVGLPDIEAPGRFALTKQVDAATLARLIYTSRHEALAVTGVELTHEKSF